MQRIKVFKGIESSVETLEEEVNAWIESSGAQILQITGNIAPQSQDPEQKGHQLGRAGYAASDVLLIVLYETS